MSPAPNSERLSADDEASFAELLAVYQEAIDASGQKSPAALRAMLDSADYWFIAHRLGGHIVGSAIVFVSGDPSFALLEYLAVAKAVRSQGIGGRLFRDAVAMLAQHYPANPLLIEVDSIGPPDAGQDLRRRRQEFYRRLGCRRIEGLKYILPLETNPPPPVMEMMVRFSSRIQIVERELLLQWLRVIYQVVYRQRLDDPRLAAMVHDLPKQIGAV